LCDDHADLVEQRSAPIEVYDSAGNHVGTVQVDP
jgi:hypothetical protein